MGYVLYHIAGKRRIRWYKAERGAKIGRAAANRNAGYHAYDIMEEGEFNVKYNGYVTVKNMMSGKDVQIRQQDVGGPCDPSTEAYWSM